MATRNGRPHKSSTNATRARSFTDSERNVIRNIVIIPATVEGIVSKLVVNVPNLSGKP